MCFSMYTTLVFRNFRLYKIGFVNINETKKSNDLYFVVVQDGMILS